MANIDDVLKKNKKKIEKINSTRKKIKRGGVTRPWQEQLDEYKEPASGAQDSSISKDQPSPTSDISPARKIAQSKKLKPAKKRHNANTTPTQSKGRADTESQHTTDTQSLEINPEIPTQPLKSNIKNPDTNTDTTPTLQSDNQNKTISTSVASNYFQKVETTQSSGTTPTRLSDTIPTHDNQGDAILNDTAISGQTKSDRHNSDTKDLLSTANTTPTRQSDTVPSQNNTTPTQQLNRVGVDQHDPNTIPTPIATQNYNLNSNSIEVLELEKAVSSLQGNALKLSYFLASYFVDTHENSVIISYDVLALKTQISSGSIRTTAKRLRNKNILDITALGKGKGASIRVSMADDIIKLFVKLFFSAKHIPAQSLHNADTGADTNASSKLVNNNSFSNFTNRKDEMIRYYEHVDLSVLDTNEKLFNNRLTREKIIGEIAKNRWEIKPHDLEEIISKFAKYINQPEAGNIRSPQSFFFSQLKKLHMGDFTDIDSVKTEHEDALLSIKQKMLAKKASREELKGEILELAFEEWMDTTTEEQRKTIAPNAYGMFSSNPEIQTKSLRAAWKSEVWPNTQEFKDYCEAVGTDISVTKETLKAESTEEFKSILNNMNSSE